MSDRPVAEAFTNNNKRTSQKTNFHTSAGIPARNPGKRATRILRHAGTGIGLVPTFLGKKMLFHFQVIYFLECTE
jgi:hypothetical protein